jgi:hypothetical protein
MGIARILVGNLIEDMRTRTPDRDVEPFLSFLDVLNLEIEADLDHERNDMTPFRLVLLDQMQYRIEKKMPNNWNNLMGSVGHALGTFILDNAIKLKGDKLNGESGVGGSKAECVEGIFVCPECNNRNAAEAPTTGEVEK